MEGGTLHNAESIGYSITHNYFSDLGRYISYSGQLNRISFWLFNGSVILCGLSFCMFFTSYNAFLQRYKVNKNIVRLATVFGVLGSLSMVGLGVTPVDLYLEAHELFATWTFRLFFPSTLCYSIALFRSHAFNNSMAYSFLIWSILVIIYVLVSELGPPGSSSPEALIFQVVAQKVIVFAFVVSIVSQCQLLKKNFLVEKLFVKNVE